MIDMLIVWVALVVPVSVVCWAAESRARRRTRKIEGPLYDWANWAIDLTGGRR